MHSTPTSNHRCAPANRLKLRTAIGAAAAGLLILTAACSNESTAEPVPRPTSSDTKRSDTNHSGPRSSEGHDHVEVRAVDFSFEGLPSTIAAGTRLSLRNDAPRELHELVAFRLPDGENRPVAELLRLPESELAPMLGRPSTVLLAPPGADPIAAVGDGTLNEPGRYLVMCSIPTGVSPGEYLEAAAAAKGDKPQVAGGPPHFTSGMFAELTVR